MASLYSKPWHRTHGGITAQLWKKKNNKKPKEQQQQKQNPTTNYSFFFSVHLGD